MFKNAVLEEVSPSKTNMSLLASEIRYRRLFESAKDGILILNAETGQIDDVNPFLIELLGYSHKQFVSKSIWDICFFKDIIASRDNFLKLREERYIRYEDVPLETFDGRKINVEFVSNVYEEAGHNVIQCNIRDITDRKRAADALAVEKECLTAILHSIGDGVITTDILGNIDIMNKVAETFCGWSQDEAHGQPLVSVFNIINGNNRKQRENPVQKVLARGEIIEYSKNTIIISKDGIERIIADSAAPIRDKKNNIIGVVLVFRDITEKQKLLETSQRNQKLESLGVLAGGIAHDFNNLMTGIFCIIDLVLEESKEPKVTQYLSKAISSMDRGRGLTQQLLTFAKGGAPHEELTNSSLLIRETVQFALSGSNVACQYGIAEDLWSCIIDKAQICQVLDNIIINALQSMPRGGVVEVSAKNNSIEDNYHPSMLKGCYIKISIKDHGIGIPAKILPCIFDPFFTTKSKGQGLGLSICYSIISRHGGTIEVESVQDEGSSFYIYLPASLEPAPENATPHIKHKGGGTIIFLDDEEEISIAMEKILERMGYSVECKKDGREVLDFFIQETKAERPISGLILDLTVPGGMGGKEIIVEIRKLNLDIPVLASSGYSDDPIMVNPAGYGFSACIRKPYTIEDVSKVLEKHINTSK